MFSRTDHLTDSERFYNSIMEVLTDPDEAKEVSELLTWWNRQVQLLSSWMISELYLCIGGCSQAALLSLNV